MKLETGNPCRVARGELKTGGSRSGIALIVTLTIMALLLILGTAFVVNMRTERAMSLNYRRQVQARQAALAGLHTGIAKMNKFFWDADALNASVATMGGRFFYTNVTGSTIGNMLMFSCILEQRTAAINTGVQTNWASLANLNGGNYKWTLPGDAQSGFYLPIANTRAASAGNWGPNAVPIYAQYIHTWTNDANRAQFAFWIDDESSKINISNAGAANLSTVTPINYDNTYSFSSVAWTPPTPLPYATIVQTPTQLSSVDLATLDMGVTGYGRKWSDSAYKVLSEIGQARNTTGTWQPFLSPDEVVGVAQNLTIQDYQAVKSCLTAWSVEKEDFAQAFRNEGGKATIPPLVARTNVGVAITTAADARKLYDFLITTNSLANSTSLKKFFGNSATFQSKYPDVKQPLTNGCVNQIAANIVSYITDTSRTPPYGSDVTTIPTGHCGLWKAAYMNEIAFSFCWQKKIDPGPTIKYQLWAAMYIELINPYEVPLPRAGQTENYTITLGDPGIPTSGPGITVTWNAMPQKPTAIAVPSANQLPVQNVANSIAAHAYSSPTSTLNPDSVPWITWQWPLTDVITTNTPPTISRIDITMPTIIRQTMSKGGGSSSGIIDWFDRSQTNPKLDILTLTSDYCKPPVVEVSALGTLGFAPPSPAAAAADYVYWNKNNPTRISIAKNDPRVHKWYGRPSSATAGIVGHGDLSMYGVTIKVPDSGGSIPGYGDDNGQNPLGNLNSDGSGGIVDFRGGDFEIYNSTYAANAKKPEYRSNFVIAETGMRSIGELGFIHTGKPWRSLSLQFYGAQVDEQQSTGNPKLGSDPAAIPDWILLDLLSVNSPPIYGRVNINTGGWHFGTGTKGGVNRGSFEVVESYPSRPNLVAHWPNAASYWESSGGNYFWSFLTMRASAYNGNGGSSYTITNPAQLLTQGTKETYTNTVASLPLAAALGVIPNSYFRNMLANFISYRKDRVTSLPMCPIGNANYDPPYRPFFTVGEICEVPCMTNHVAGWGTPINPNSTSNPVAYTDADREDTVRRIINVLTTHGDVFTVHVIGQADSGEARLMAVVERIRDPAVAGKNRFRILQTRWITN